MREDHVKITPSQKEIDLQRHLFEESAFSGGTHVKYFSVKKKELTTISDEMYEWNDPIEIDIIYDERPKVSLLKRYNWYTEDTDIQPKIMYIPSKVEGQVLNVRRGDLVEVPNPLKPDESDLFQVSATRTELVALMFICNVVPFRKQVAKEGNPSLNNSWLKK